MRHRLFLAALAPIVLTAGCLGATDAPAPAALDALAPALEYVCPPGGEETREDGLCVGRLASVTESMQEPYLAVDPRRPDVLAIGVNGGHTVRAVDPMRERPGFDWFSVDVYVSEDGGESWTLRQVPFVPAPQPGVPLDTGGSFDPALAFDERGVLHVSGIVSWGRTTPLVRGYEVFYVSSPDLGRTWSEPVLFTTDSDNDRNWITVAPGGVVFVTWQNLWDSSEVAWSLDGGATWAGPAVAEECPAVSPVLVHDGVPLLACHGYTGDRYDAEDGCDDFDPRELTGIRIHALDVATGDLSLLGAVGGPGGTWPMLRTLADGSLVVAYDECEGGTHRPIVARSDDGGRAWSEPVDVFALTSVDDSWPTARIHWVEADPSEGLHLFVAWPNDPWTSTRAAAHVALDATLSRASERLVHVEGATPDRVPPSLGWAAGDHFYGIGFTPDGTGLLVWSNERTLEYTAFRPAAVSP